MSARGKIRQAMEPEELRPIVDAWGGEEAFAAVIDASPKTVSSWLEGKRTIRPMVAKLIRSLAAPPAVGGSETRKVTKEDSEAG